MTYEQELENKFTVERLIALKEKIKHFDLPLCEKDIDRLIAKKLNNLL